MIESLLTFLAEASGAQWLALRLTALLAAAWAIHLAIRRRDPRWRVALWRWAAAGLVAVPLIGALPSMLTLDAPAPEPVGAVLAWAASAPAPSAPAWNWGAAMAAGWFAVAGLLLIRSVGAAWRLRGMIRAARPAERALRRMLDRQRRVMDVRRPVELRISDDAASPLLFGWRRPVIVLPSGVIDARFRPDLPAIFAHELAHLRGRDLPWLAAVRLTAIALWFHPLAWRMPAAHALAAEERGDAVAASSLGDEGSYAGTLARLALAINNPLSCPGGMTMIQTSQTRRRLERLRLGTASAPLGRARTALCMAAALAIFTLVGTVRVTRAEQTQDPVKLRPTAQQAVVVEAIDPSAQQIVFDVIDPLAQRIVFDVIDPSAQQIVFDVIDPSAQQIFFDVIDPSAQQIVFDVIDPSAQQIVFDVIDPLTQTRPVPITFVDLSTGEVKVTVPELQSIKIDLQVLVPPEIALRISVEGASEPELLLPRDASAQVNVNPLRPSQSTQARPRPSQSSTGVATYQQLGVRPSKAAQPGAGQAIPQHLEPSRGIANFRDSLFQPYPAPLPGAELTQPERGIAIYRALPSQAVRPGVTQGEPARGIAVYSAPRQPSRDQASTKVIRAGDLFMVVEENGELRLVPARVEPRRASTPGEPAAEPARRIFSFEPGRGESSEPRGIFTFRPDRGEAPERGGAYSLIPGRAESGGAGGVVSYGPNRGQSSGRGGNLSFGPDRGGADEAASDPQGRPMLRDLPMIGSLFRGDASSASQQGVRLFGWTGTRTIPPEDGPSAASDFGSRRNLPPESQPEPKKEADLRSLLDAIDANGKAGPKPPVSGSIR